MSQELVIAAAQARIAELLRDPVRWTDTQARLELGEKVTIAVELNKGTNRVT